MVMLQERRVALTELPRWARDAVQQEFQRKQPHCYVALTDTVIVPPNMWDYNPRVLYFYLPGKAAARHYDGVYDSITATPNSMFTGASGGVLPQGAEYLIIDKSPVRRVTLYTREWVQPHPEVIRPTLTLREEVILCLSQFCISSYRRLKFSRVRPTGAELAHLKELGLLTKNGAITLAGRQIVDECRNRKAGSEPPRIASDSDAMRVLGLSPY